MKLTRRGERVMAWLVVPGITLVVSGMLAALAWLI